MWQPTLQGSLISKLNSKTDPVLPSLDPFTALSQLRICRPPSPQKWSRWSTFFSHTFQNILRRKKNSIQGIFFNVKTKIPSIFFRPISMKIFSGTYVSDDFKVKNISIIKNSLYRIFFSS